MSMRDSFERLKASRPKSVTVTDETAVRKRWLDGDGRPPRVVEPASDRVDLMGWARGHRTEVESDLLEAGAVLFRGFDVAGLDEFRQVADALCDGLFDYRERSTPRSEVGENVYTSTEYPADQPIPLHNELSYAARWPRKIWFFCAEPPDDGGTTPIADSRQVLAELDPAVRRRFEARGVLYVRNYGDGLGLTWQEAFQTEDVTRVEEHCRESGLDFEWLGEGRLRTRVVRPATVEHPTTGDRVWFNQAHLHHVSALDEETRAALLEMFQEDELPFNTFYGDGAPIPEADVRAVDAAFERASIRFPWLRGDLLMLDNVLFAHGRDPFRGNRRIVVSMAEPTGLS